MLLDFWGSTTQVLVKRSANVTSRISLEECVRKEKTCRAHTTASKSAYDDAKRQGGDQLKAYQFARKKGGTEFSKWLLAYIATCKARQEEEKEDGGGEGGEGEGEIEEG